MLEDFVESNYKNVYTAFVTNVKSPLTPKTKDSFMT